MKKSIIRNFYIILICLLVIIGVSFALFNVNLIGHREHTIDVDGLVFRYTESSSGISLDNPDPMNDIAGMASDNYFDFSIYISNENNYALTYNIYLKELAGNNLSTNYVKVYLTDQDNNQIVQPSKVAALKLYPNDTDSYILYTNTIAPANGETNNTQNYRLRIWLDEDYINNSIIETVDGNKQTTSIEDSIFSFKVNIDNLTIIEDVENPTITSATTSNEVTSVRKAITVVASDNIGLRGYLITNNNTTPNIEDNWNIATNNSWTSDSIYTNGTYYAWVKDGNNNISSAEEVTVSNVNIIEPICTWSGPNKDLIRKNETTTFVLTCTDLDNQLFTDSDVTSNDIVLSNPNVASISEPVKEEQANNSGYTYTFTLTGITNGFITLVAKSGIVSDYYGNVNKASLRSSLLTVSTLTAGENNILINNNDGATTNENVSLTLNQSDATKVCFSNSSNINTDCDPNGDNYSNYEVNKTYTLPSGDGEKTIYAYFKTPNGDVSGSDSIILDNTNPTCTITATNLNDWSFSKTLTINGVDEGSGIAINGYSFDNVTYSSVNLIDITSNNAYTYYVKDNAGNINSCSLEVTKVDSVAPVISSASYLTTTNLKTSISYVANDITSLISGYLIKTNNEIPSINDIGWIANSNTNVTTDEIYIDGTYYLFVKDNAGNISSPYEIIIDNHTAPECRITVSPDGIASSKVLTVTSTNTDLDTNPYSWTSELTGFTNTNTKEITSNGIYSAWVKDSIGNVGTCSVTITNIVLDASGANQPELATGMIPVYYDATATCSDGTGCWKKADSTNNDSNYQWYNYESSGAKKGMWANAVTVTNTNRDTLIASPLGTEIPMSDINTMWVWIPRFSAVTPTNYNGGSALTPGAIDVTYIDISTPSLDAFWWDENSNGVADDGEQKSGFWYGKFETSHTTLSSSTTTNNLGCSTETCSNANGIIIKPSVTQLRYNNVSNFFYAGRSMEQANNSFGFVSSEVDTHMSKNNEWGAVAYLTQSIYGRCSNSTTCTEVGINNNSYITGMSDYITNINQSTTGTVYGIYDMSGGSYEYVMGNYSNNIGSSGFGSMPSSKYYNLYTGTSYIGHALSETSGWYNDFALFLTLEYPWIARSGEKNSGSLSPGIFLFSTNHGNKDERFATRFALVK